MGDPLPHIDLYFVAISPWTYLAMPRFREIAARHGADVTYKPADYGRVFKATGGLQLNERSEARKEYRLQELRRARIVGMAAPGRHFRPAEDLPGLLSVLQKIYPDVRITADYPADAILPCDRDDLLEVLGNLLDNACKYGGDNVACDITTTEEFWQLSVCDNGPGIAAARQAQILQRGIRLDEQGIDGSGLGLAMVGDIVRSYGGHLKLSNHQHGGLLVRVQLPAQAEVRTCDQRVLQHSPGRPW